MPLEKAKKGEESKKLGLKKARKLLGKLRKGEKSVRTSTEADPPEAIEECERTQDFTVSSAYQAAGTVRVFPRLALWNTLRLLELSHFLRRCVCPLINS